MDYIIRQKPDTDLRVYRRVTRLLALSGLFECNGYGKHRAEHVSVREEERTEKDADTCCKARGC
ncbi:hypothetical protein F9883_04080 [Morganella morganii]|nr:hypothetical protein [Morganella morganii]HAE77417.1 hypothetical protein [Morganella sp. (in: enterobacteria)]